MPRFNRGISLLPRPFGNPAGTQVLLKNSSTRLKYRLPVEVAVPPGSTACSRYENLQPGNELGGNKKLRVGFCRSPHPTSEGVVAHATSSETPQSLIRIISFSGETVPYSASRSRVCKQGKKASKIGPKLKERALPNTSPVRLERSGG